MNHVRLYFGNPHNPLNGMQFNSQIECTQFIEDLAKDFVGEKILIADFITSECIIFKMGE